MKECNGLDRLTLCTAIVSMNDCMSDTSSYSSESESCDESLHDEDFSSLLTLATIGQYVEVNKPIEDTSINFCLRKKIDDFNESQCILEFRFKKAHLHHLLNSIWPRISPYLKGTKESLKCINGYRCPYETAFLIMLHRFARPRRLRPDSEEFFCIRKSHLSAVLDTITRAVDHMARKYLRDPCIFAHRMKKYSDSIYEKCGLVETVWGFIDGTLRKTCRPTYFQRNAYSGHKRCHGLKFLSITTPDGLIAMLHGPINGNRHDSHMLRESCIINKLRDMMPVHDVTYSLYGDPAYPQCMYLFGGFRNPAPGSVEASWNT